MNRNVQASSTARRLFLSRIGAGVGLAGVSLVGSRATAAEVVPDASWRPARHMLDDWLDDIPGVHRLLFDVTTADIMSQSLLFALNFFAVNHADYGLKDSDLAVVIVARHKATSFGFNDAMWAKYGKQLSQHAEFTDPATGEPPTVNVFTVAASSSTPPGFMSLLAQRGLQVAVCNVSTQTIARRIAQETGGSADSIAKEMTANLVANARMVPAGIVAMNRAQERGYSLG